MTPYSPLAAGRVCRLPTDEVTKRSSDDPGNVRKYEHSKNIDLPVIKRIKEVADKMKISMAQVSLAWILTKPLVVSPVIGCTKISQLESLCDVFKIKLNEEDIKYLEELYLPHKVVGALSKNK